MSKDEIHYDGTELAAAIAALNSEDALTQNDGVERAIRIGSPAVPELLQVLGKAVGNRAQVMYALSQIGDTRAASAFLAGLRDEDERVRAYAAQGLTRIGNPTAMAASIQTLNDAADELHLDMTPAVRSLGEMGLKAVPPLLDLLMNVDEMTRLHAQRALEMILSRRHGFIPAQGYSSSKAEEAMRSEWRDHGDYDYSADANARSASVAKWREWLEKAKGSI